MSLAEILVFFSTGCALASAGCAVFVALRAQKWRDSDDAKALLERVDEVEDRLSRLETRASDLPTRADIARLEGEIDGLTKLVERTVVPGLTRMEGYFLQLGVERTR